MENADPDDVEPGAPRAVDLVPVEGNGQAIWKPLASWETVTVADGTGSRVERAAGWDLTHGAAGDYTQPCNKDVR